MNRIIFLFLLLLSIIDCLKSENSIIKSLENNINPLEGVIKIESDQEIMTLIDTEDEKIYLKQNKKCDEKSPKFCIQILITNVSHTMYSEILSKQEIIKKNFPNLPTYLIYGSPNWKLLVGDFLNWKDAVCLKKQLQKKIPEFGKGIHIIIDIYK